MRYVFWRSSNLVERPNDAPIAPLRFGFREGTGRMVFELVIVDRDVQDRHQADADRHRDRVPFV